jgi:hypothetical protein
MKISKKKKESIIISSGSNLGIKSTKLILKGVLINIISSINTVIKYHTERNI